MDVAAVLAAMTLEEKAALLDGSDFWRTEPLPRHDVSAVQLSDGPHGLRRQAEGDDHLGLQTSVPATCFPPAAGLASSWDPDLVREVGGALGAECRAAGVSVLLGPGVNIKRTPLCGRNFEYWSEDPLLAGHLATAYVQGVQSQGVGTSLKHFAANNQETDRMTVSADVDERTLREIYLPAFERVVTEAQPWTVMCSYNRVNGTYASEDPWLLTTVLRDQWGFEGLVVSDWGAVDQRDLAVAAGLDLEMPSSSGAGARRIVEAVGRGDLSVDAVDRSVARVLQLVDRAQPALSDRPPFDVDAHHELARRAAVESAVLLKNDGDVLPLDPREGETIAVIGEFARTPRFQGAGSSQVNPTRLDTALDALTASVGERAAIRFSPGYTVDADDASGAMAASMLTEAVGLAGAVSTVVLFLGLPPSYESEGYDRERIDLPAEQLALLRAVIDANARTIVVLSNGSVVAVSDWIDLVPAVLEGWLLGQAGGSATVDLLLGTVAPSGKLAETIPARLADNPTVGNFPGEHGHVRYGEGLLVGYRWYDAHELPVAFPFGHGLSYTTFDYDDLRVHVDGTGTSVTAEVTVTVRNSGARSGVETVQVYVADPTSTVYRPERELRAFQRVALDAGESRTVTITLDGRAFAFWHEPLARWVVEGGEFVVSVGGSSRDLPLSASIEVEGDDITPPLSTMSTAEQWLADPNGGTWLREKLAGTGAERTLTDPRNGQMMRAIPLQRLARMPEFPVTEDEINEAVETFS